MTPMDAIKNGGIVIDADAELLYGTDQVYIDCPVTFPTVSIELCETGSLDRLADAIRAAEGFKPMFPDDTTDPDSYDPDGWYNFYVTLNGYSKHHVDNCIEFTVQSENAPDDWQSNSIDLTEEEQAALYAVLDAQLREHFGKSAAELLAEAAQESDYAVPREINI